MKSMKKLNRRDFLRLSAAAATGAIVAACAPAAPQIVEVEKEVPVEKVVKETVVVEKPAKPAEIVEIRFEDESEVGPDGFAVFTDVLIAKFEEENPSIRVKFEPAIGDWVPKITAQMAAGEAPDVMVAYGGFARHWMETGQLLPLQEHFTEDMLTDFYEQQLIAFKIGPSLFEIPKYVSTIVLSYSKDLFDEADLDYPDGTWTWDDFLQAVEKLTVRDAAGKAEQWGYRVPTGYLKHWVWQNGGEWMNKDVLGTKCLLDQPLALEALRFHHDILYKHKLSPLPYEVEGVGYFDTFQTGKLGMNEAHSWQVTDYLRRNDFHWDFAVLTQGRGGIRAGTNFADGYGIYVRTNYPNASVEFLEHITSPEAEKVMCTSVLGLQPSRKSVAPVWDSESEGAKAGYNVQAFSQVMEYTRLDPYFLDHAKVWEEIMKPLWDRIWVVGDLPLEEGLNEIAKRVNEYLASIA